MRFLVVLAASVLPACGALLGSSDDGVEPPARVADGGVDAASDGASDGALSAEGSSDASADADAAQEAEAAPYVKRVFVTSDFVDPSFGALSNADAICQTFAQGGDKSLVGRLFFAFLAGPNGEAPESRASNPNAPYARMDGVIVFPNGLAGGDPVLEIAFDEKMGNHVGATNDKAVWTGLATGGTIDARTCNKWTSNASTAFAGYGDVPFDTSMPVQWKQHGGNTLACNDKGRLYCFEK